MPGGVATGAETPGVVVDARLLDDGGVAGVRPAIATASGFDCSAGCCGVAERATTDESSGDLSCFHQAKRGAVWQPLAARATTANIIMRSVVRFIAMPNREVLRQKVFAMIMCAANN
jgi:hypothetical protein